MTRSQSANVIDGPVVGAGTKHADSSVDDTAALMLKLNLPEIPDSKKRFSAARLSARDYARIKALWSASSLATWLCSVVDADSDADATEIMRVLVGAITHHIPTMSWVRAEQIGGHIVASFEQSGFLVRPHDDNAAVVELNRRVTPSSVFPLLTGMGCYSYVHQHEARAPPTSAPATTNTRCYSPRCARTIPSVQQQTRPASTTIDTDDWAAFWGISPESLGGYDRREVKRQYAIHELIMGEETYISDLSVLVNVYGASLKKMSPAILQGQDEFWTAAFGTVETLIAVNSQHLLSQFKQRQQTSGPLVSSIADIIIEWLRHSRNPYLKYTDSYVIVDQRLRKEQERNPAFVSWFERMAKDPRTKSKPHSFYFHRAIPRLTRYGLLLRAIHHATPESNPEYALLERAIAECDALSSDCNRRLEAVQRTAQITDLHERIQFKSAEEEVDLHLSEGHRKIVRTGDVLRRGDLRLDWIETHLILLDNFLVLSKIRKGPNGARYYVTKRPIPLELLDLESDDDPPVTKSSATTKLGVGTFTSSAPSTTSRRSLQLGSLSPTREKADPNGGPPSPTAQRHSTVTVLDDYNARDVMYPFRIAHLGRKGDDYTLYASSNMDREKWRDAIVSAKRDFASRVFAMNSEPFRLQVIANYAFGYGASTPKLPIFVPATAVDRALTQYKEPQPSAVPRPLSSARVNCGTSFVFGDGKIYFLIGTDYGVYVRCDEANAKWVRCLDIARVSQIDVIEDLDLVVLITEKSLAYFHLDAVISHGFRKKPTAPAASLRSSEPTGYRLSRHRKVGFFAVGRMKDRTLLFYKKLEGQSSMFKVMEPIKEKGSQRRRSKITLSRNADVSSTEYMREVEKFYVPTDSSGISLFNNSFAVHSARGFEILSLDYKTPQTVPVASSVNQATLNKLLKAKSMKHISAELFKRKLDSLKPVGMFRVAENLLIMCYDELAVFCDNGGNLAGPAIIEFICRAKYVALQHPYLIAADDQVVEVHNVGPSGSGNLCQVITGRDMRLIDTHEKQVMVAMAHPKLPGRQLILELVESDNHAFANPSVGF